MNSIIQETSASVPFPSGIELTPRMLLMATGSTLLCFGVGYLISQKLYEKNVISADKALKFLLTFTAIGTLAGGALGAYIDSKI